MNKPLQERDKENFKEEAKEEEPEKETENCRVGREKKKCMILRELHVGKLGRGFTTCPIQKIPSVGEEQLELSHTTDTSVNGTCTIWQYQS